MFVCVVILIHYWPICYSECIVESCALMLVSSTMNNACISWVAFYCSFLSFHVSEITFLLFLVTVVH